MTKQDAKKQKPFSKGSGKPNKRPKLRKQEPPKPNAPFNMIWGLHAAKEAWSNPGRKIVKAFATERAAAQMQTRIAKAKDAGLKRPELQIIERKNFQHITKLHDDLVHQGIALQVEDLPEIFLDEVLGTVEGRPHALLLVLDQVTDPHNVGAILRSAAAFGADGLIMQTRHAPGHLNGALAKIACGAAEHIPVVMETNLARAIETCKERGFQAYAFDERAENALGKIPLHGRSVLVLGAEGKGVRPSVKDACDHTLKLDTQAPINSLNVSNAAAVALYEYTRLKQ